MSRPATEGERAVARLLDRQRGMVGLPPRHIDRHGNMQAREGCDRCECGCKYWENDCCIDCGAHVSMIELAR